MVRHCHNSRWNSGEIIPTRPRADCQSNSGITSLPDPIRPRQKVQIRQVRRRPRQPLRRRLSTRSLTLQRLRPITRRCKSRRRWHVRSRDEPRRDVPTILRRRRHGRWVRRRIRYISLSFLVSPPTNTLSQAAAAASSAAQASSSTWAAAPACASTNSAATAHADAHTTTQQPTANRKPQAPPSNPYYHS